MRSLIMLPLTASQLVGKFKLMDASRFGHGARQQPDLHMRIHQQFITHQGSHTLLVTRAGAT